MYKYIFTIAKILNARSGQHRIYDTNIKISELFDETIGQMDWIMVLLELELTYAVDIPDELYEGTDLTLEEFAEELSQLPEIQSDKYYEFYDIKIETMALTDIFSHLLYY